MWFSLSEFGKSKWNANDLWRLWNSGQDTNFHQSMGISEKLDAHTASSIITMNFPVSDENMSIVFFWNLWIWFCTVCNDKEKRTLSIILFISRGGEEKPPYDGYWPWIHRYKAKPRLPPDGISQKSLSARSPCPWYHSQPYITPSRKEIFLQIKKNPNIYLAFWCRILQRWIPRETWFGEQLSLFIKTLTLQSRTVRN